MPRLTQWPRYSVTLARFVAIVFGVFALSASRLYAQETLADSKPWPPDPPLAASACEGQQVFDLFNPWNTANAEEIADLAVLAAKDAAQMTSCFDAYHHPKYALWRAFFAEVAAQGYFYHSDYADGNRYLKLAQSDLRLVSKYTNLPANFEKALIGNLKLEGMIERQAETRSNVLSDDPSSEPNAQVGYAGLPWPSNPSSISVECGKDNETKLTNATISAVNDKLYSDAVTDATKGMAQMTACIEAYGHPDYFLYRAFFEGTAAGSYSMQRDAANSVRYLRLAQSDLQHLSLYTGLPNDVQAQLQAAQNIVQAAGNIGRVGSANDSHSLHAVSCAAIAQRPPNEFWVAMAQSGLAPVPRPETLLGVTFENTAQIPLTDLRVHYDFLDAFGDVIASLDGVWSGTFSPNTVINFGTFGTGIKDLGLGGAIEKPPLVNASQVKNVSCYVSGARWSDGTVRSYTASGDADGENPQAPM